MINYSRCLAVISYPVSIFKLFLKNIISKGSIYLQSLFLKSHFSVNEGNMCV